MSNTIINPQTWPRPSGYSYGVRVSGGRLLFVAGQIGTDSDHNLKEKRNFLAQFDRALANVVTVVESAGARAQDIVKLTIFVTNRTEYLQERARLGPIYRQRMAGHYPAMTLVEVKGLIDDDACVEIDAIAVIP